MRTIPAFSKKSSSGPTVGGNGERSGFTPHVKSTHIPKPKSPPNMAGGFTKSVISKGGGGSPKQVPSFKGRSSSGLKSAPAFSKKKI